MSIRSVALLIGVSCAARGALAQPPTCYTGANAHVYGWGGQAYNQTQDSGNAPGPTTAYASGGGSSGNGCGSQSDSRVDSQYGWASMSGSGTGVNCLTSDATIYVQGTGARTQDLLQISSTTLPAGTRVPIRIRVEMVGTCSSVQPGTPFCSMRTRLEFHPTFNATFVTLDEPGVSDQTVDTATVGGTVQLLTFHWSVAGASSPFVQTPNTPQVPVSCSVNTRARFIIESLDPRVTITACSGHNYAAGACPADVDDGTGSGIPDGGVTIDDLLYFLELFETGSIFADLDDGSATGTPDQGVTIDDLVYFLTRFQAGC